MFTGLIEATSTVISLTPSRLEVAFPPTWADAKVVLGESISICGCCLTAVEISPLSFDLSEETISRSSLATWQPGKVVNLERAMALGDRLGGHIVQGHVDTTGRVRQVSEHAGSWTFEFEVVAEFDRYFIDKGSVSVDGISLTIVEPRDGRFTVAVIPHTFAHTNLGSLAAADTVNIEFDVLAKHVEKLLRLRD